MPIEADCSAKCLAKPLAYLDLSRRPHLSPLTTFLFQPPFSRPPGRGFPKLPDRATLVPSPTSLIADLYTLIARRAPPTQTLACYKSRALLAFEKGALCPLSPRIKSSYRRIGSSVSSVHRRLREFRAGSDTQLRHHPPVGWCC